jgi:hypothetical protein
MRDSAPLRRRFQFRLRTLMIGVTLVAAACACVGSQAKIVRDRRAIVAWILTETQGSCILDSVRITERGVRVPPDPNWLRRILGDRSFQYIVIPTEELTADRLNTIKAAFPESVVETIPIAKWPSWLSKSAIE